MTSNLKQSPGDGPKVVQLQPPEEDYDLDEAILWTKSTVDDVHNMRRMGKSQQLVRNFRLFSIASFTAMATAAWVIGLFEITPALVDGGRPALLYSTLWNFVGFCPIYLSMAEMSSMAPIAGAQYHWVSEFAPPSIQKPLSYFTGWTSTMAWQSGNALGVFLVGTLIQGIIQINKPDYSFPPWQATLLVIGAVIIAYVGNVYGAKILPYWQNAAFIAYLLVYIAIIVTVWVNAPRATSDQVWREFSNDGGWSNMGLTVLAGQISGIYTQVGVDTAAHMAEDVKDAASTIPKAMMMVYIINFCLFFPAAVTICYHIPNVSHALADPTLYPTIYVLRHAMPTGWLTAVLILIILLLICSNICYLAGVTRDLFAFGRDRGLPFSAWISKVEPNRKIPRNAALLTSVASILLGLIYIGSPVAFYAITSLLTVALLQCYALSIGCLLWRRLQHPETLPPAKFSLGRFGVAINFAAVAYALWAFFWAFWPQYADPTAALFNWSSVIFVGVLILAGFYFVVRARHTYSGPVASIRGRGVDENVET